MFLKSLSMKGFKSFADPTVLEMEPGMTVVVGPNGSGKSNVVDAVTWVLGAQGPRALRSQKMEDVIFAGTSSRPALGRAEVSLTIDNSSRKLPVDLAEVTITRTLFRSGDSEYAINGTPCRLLDIQDLLSDSGVGRSQHMIVGQGQLDAVLNARPEDRRAVIEEAAGVLKHRRRRERAERRLAATQENLERLGDLVREVRRQIRPLERQAQAARSHAALAAELRAVRIHLAGAELVELAARRRAASDGLTQVTLEEAEIRAAADRLDAEMAATSAELSLRAEDDLASSLGWVQALVERAKGTGNVVRERARATAAALDAAADVDVVSTLDAEASRLSAELSAAEEEEAAFVPERESLEVRARELAADLEAHRSRFGATEEPVAVAALADAERKVAVARHTLDQQRRSLRTAGDRLTGLDGRLSEMDSAIAELDRRSAALEAEAARLAQTAAAAEADRAATREAAERAENEARAADRERHRTAARAEALARALHELEGLSGREALNGIDGVVGSLVDLVEIDPGWEAAFEAAAGASVSAVVVSGRDAARAALDRLHRKEATGALLAAHSRRSGGHPSLEEPLPEGAEPLRPHVRARRSAGTGGDDAVEAVIDAVCGGAVRVEGWEAALDLALDRPDLVVVTAHGDRFAQSGWRVRTGRGVVTAAAVEEAERRAADAAERADAANAGAISARAGRDAAALAAADAVRARDRHEAARAAVEAERRRAGQERERVAAELVEGRLERERLARELEADEERLSGLEAEVASAAMAAETAKARAVGARAEASEIDGRRRELEASRQALEVREAGLEERRRVLTERHAEVERRLSGHAEEREAAAARRRRLEADGMALRRLGGVVDRELQRLEAVLGALRADYADQIARSRAGAVRMEALRRERAALEERQATTRERVRQLDREQAEASARQEALAETVEADLGVTVDEAMSAPRPELPEGTGASDHAAHLAAELAALGPVNPLALEELSALEARHHELDTQMEDVRSARRQLHEVARELDRQIAEQFAAAAADVGEHFSELVSTLFPGGTGRLTLTDPEDLLGTGVEIEVRPAGRNVRRVSLLSGGERSMAALAFLFAVFRSRPSPFYLMDEVEAALDDVNLHRFLGLVRQFRHEAQLIVVSHQKRTMEAADALYGVTMAPGGSSQVVSQRAPRQEVAGTLVSP